jgi:hypothetical protein
MIVPQKIKKVANAAYKAPEKIMVNVTSHAVDAKKFVASIGKKTATAESVSSSKAVTIAHPKAEASLLANTLLWAHLIPPMPLIASTVYTHYINGNTNYSIKLFYYHIYIFN